MSACFCSHYAALVRLLLGRTAIALTTSSFSSGSSCKVKWCVPISSVGSMGSMGSVSGVGSLGSICSMSCKVLSMVSSNICCVEYLAGLHRGNTLKLLPIAAGPRAPFRSWTLEFMVYFRNRNMWIN